MPLEVTHFKSDGKTVTIIGSGVEWEGYITEIEFFSFHAGRIARFVGAEHDPATIAYQADGYLYGFCNEGGGHHGMFAEVPPERQPIAIQEVIHDLS